MSLSYMMWWAQMNLIRERILEMIQDSIYKPNDNIGRNYIFVWFGNVDESTHYIFHSNYITYRVFGND